MGEGFPLWSLASMAWEGREPLRDWICLSISLCFCSLDSALSPFLIYPEISNSNWIETFRPDFSPKISFLAEKEERQPPYGWPTRVRGAPRGAGAPPASWPPRAPSRVNFSSKKSYIFQKKLSVNFYPVWTPFDMDILRNKNMQQTRTGTGHWINMLVPKII